MKALALLTALAALTIAPVSLSAKGNTVRILIRGGALATPIEITDAAAIAPFQVLAGPGTSTNDEQSLNVDWSQGIAPAPRDLPIYEVSFVTNRSDHSTYLVRYAIDPNTYDGYVYIPGKADTGYKDNVWMIYRGNEGHWFHASSKWDRFAQPLITKALAGR